MKFKFEIFDRDDDPIFTEIVSQEDFLRVFGTETPDENDVDEAALQLLRYMDGTRVKTEQITSE